MSQRYKEDAQMISRCLDGDINAFEPLVDRYQNAAFATALGFVHDRQEAEDLAQEALVTAYSRLAELRNPETFAAWLRRIVQNACQNWLRRQQMQQRHLDQVGSDEGRLMAASYRQHDEDTQKDDLWHTVQNLPPLYRDVTLMHYLSGLPYADIADFMGISVTTIKSRLHQARLLLKTMLTEPIEIVESNKESITVSNSDWATFIKKIQDKTCRIGSISFQKTIALDDVDHIVVYCGESTDMTVTHTDGDDLIVEGVKSSLGSSEKEAKESAKCIGILSDRVENYEAVGPHEGEMPYKETFDKEGYHLSGLSSVEDWRMTLDENRCWRQDDLLVGDLFPFLNKYSRRLPDALRVKEPAVRLSILRKQVESLTLLKKDVTDEMHSVYHPWTYDKRNGLGPIAFGPIGHVNLTLKVPMGKKVTIMHGRKVHVADYRASVQVIQANVELSNVEGDVYLWESQLVSATRMRGKLTQIYHHFYGRNRDFGNDRYLLERPTPLVCTLEDIKGDIDIDVGVVNIEASKLAGSVRIRNMYGTTRLYQNTFKTGNQYQLSSQSGEIFLYLKQRLLSKVNYTIQTLCGTVKHVGPQDFDFENMRTTPLLAVSTIRPKNGWGETQNVDFLIQTESGDVTLEKTK